MENDNVLIEMSPDEWEDIIKKDRAKVGNKDSIPIDSETKEFLGRIGLEDVGLANAILYAAKYKHIYRKNLPFSWLSRDNVDTMYPESISIEILKQIWDY